MTEAEAYKLAAEIAKPVEDQCEPHRLQQLLDRIAQALRYDVEPWTYRQFARVYPHECYDLDPERFWRYFQAECPGVSREVMERELEATRD